MQRYENESGLEFKTVSTQKSCNYISSQKEPD